MPIGLEDLENLSTAIAPSTETIVERSKNWEKLFEKYSIEQTEEDAVDWDDFEKLNIGDDDGELLPEADEDSECPSEAENNGEALPHLQPEEKLSYHFTPELLNELKKVFAGKVAELGKLNLPLWNYERKETTVGESVLSTPDFSITSRKMRSNHEKVTSMLSLHQKAADKINVNGAVQSNTDISSTIASLLAIGAGFSMKIREREYDIEVKGGDSGALKKACSVPSIAKPKIPAAEVKRLANTRKASLSNFHSKEKFTKTAKKPSAKIVEEDEQKSINNIKSKNRLPKKHFTSSSNDSNDDTSSSSSCTTESSTSSQRSAASTKPVGKDAKTKKAPKADTKSRKALAASDNRSLSKAKASRVVKAMTSIVISDSDESDDDFYLPKTPERKPPLPLAIKPKPEEISDASSCSDEDNFWLPKQSTVKKAPKNRAKFDENQSPKKIRKLKS